MSPARVANASKLCTYLDWPANGGFHQQDLSQLITSVFANSSHAVQTTPTSTFQSVANICSCMGLRFGSVEGMVEVEVQSVVEMQVQQVQLLAVRKFLGAGRLQSPKSSSGSRY